MQCVILVGGLGTRLGSLTATCPKPMLTVAGRPFLEHIIDNVARFGFRDVLLLAGHLGSCIRDHFASGRLRTPAGLVHIEILIEPELSGTGGALRMAGSRLRPQFLLINGDSMLSFNLLDLATTLPPHTVGRLALMQVQDSSHFGVVSRARGDIITAMEERSSAAGAAEVNAGMYWLRREVLSFVPSRGVVSLERDTFPRLIAAGALLGSCYSGRFIDIGLPETYAAAQTPPPNRRPALFLDRDGVLNEDAGYTHVAVGLKWVDGAIEAVRWANDNDYYVFVVSNQAGVAKGYFTENHVLDLHAWMSRQLLDYGAHVDAWMYCPHHPDGTVAQYRHDCVSRKPRPGMIEYLLETWDIDKEHSLLVGDKNIDLEAAAMAGVRGALYKCGNLRRFVEEHLTSGRP